MPTVNPAIRSPVSHPTSAKIAIKKVSKNGVERQTVAGNPAENGKQAQEVFLDLRKYFRKPKRRKVACVRVEPGC